MPNDLPFALREPYTEIPIEGPDEFWEIISNQDEAADLLYWPETLKGGENPEKIYVIKGKTFLNVSFAKTEISNLNFTNCIFEDCIFFLTKFVHLEFHDCTFKNCNFGKCRISETYIDPISFSECLNIKKDANIGTYLFQQLMRNFKDLDQPDFYRGAEFRFRRFRRSETWHKMNNGKVSLWKGCPMIFGNFLGEKILGYGVKINRFIVSTFILFMLFWGANYFFWGEFELTAACETCLDETWDKSLYYTAISLSNLGYGDIIPSSTFGRISASIQAVTGAIWFAVMASMIFKRITSR